MRRMLNAAAIVLLSAMLPQGPAQAGSASNTRWYSSVNRHAVIVREGGVFRIVDDQSGYTLYDDGYCKKLLKSGVPAIASQLKSKLIYFCSRDLKRSEKSAWSESEFHLTTDGGRDVWRLVWINETDANGKLPSVASRIKAARAVAEYASFNKVLDGIACKVKFEKNVNNSEWVSVNSPFGNCADGQVKDGALAAGVFKCETGVDPTFLGKRTVKLINRGDARKPELLLTVSGREPQKCAIETTTP